MEPTEKIEETQIAVDDSQERVNMAISFLEEKVGRAYNLTRDELREKVVIITGGELTITNKEKE